MSIFISSSSSRMGHLVRQEAGAQSCFSSQLIGVGNGAGPLAIITYRASAATRM